MNSDLRRLRRELEDPKQRGMRDKIAVDYFTLISLMDDYERIDSQLRAMHGDGDSGCSLTMQLDLLVRAMFHKHGRDAVAVITEIMSMTLANLEEIERPRKVLDKIKDPYR